MATGCGIARRLSDALVVVMSNGSPSIAGKPLLFRLMERVKGMIPKYFFLTKGVGRHKENLASFELALRDAGIQHCNLVPVSSIIPPGCKLIPREKGIPMLHAGEITFVVLARNCTDEPHRLIASSIGIAIPSEENQYGYLSEHHSFGQTEEIAGDYSEDLAASMLATTMGVTFDPATAWDERKQLFMSSGLIIKTTEVTQSATGDKNGLWTSVVAAAVFLPATTASVQELLPPSNQPAV